jgi:hypothetical protein
MHRVIGRRHPGDLGVLAAPVGALQGPAQALISQPQPHSADRPAHRELLEHRTDHAGDSLIGVESDLSVGFAPDQPDRQPATQVAAGGLAADSAVQAGPQHMEFSLAHDALETEDEAVIKQPGVVDAVGVGDQRVARPGQIQQPVPRCIVADQP